YEVIPLEGAEEAVLEHVPAEVKVTVTTSPAKGLESTLILAERLAGHGYAVVPHLSARLVHDRIHLAELVERLRAAGTQDVFVIAGDATKRAGEFDGAAALLRALEDLGHPFTEVGITGYPESHAFISDETTIQAMFEKAEFATYIVSQICFDPQVTVDWIEAVWKRGTRLPIHIGLPGAVPRAKLLRLSARIGVGESIRFLRGHGSWITRALKPGGFSPDPLIASLEPSLAGRERKVAGFHFFTFNNFADTEHWRQQALERYRNDR
ncbi:MAG: methylenetetrahydrofolate reductase, partial [Steroidobacteraceae bacterium]